MSNPPSGYNTPKTNWQSADVVSPTDMNRIEGNIEAHVADTSAHSATSAPTANRIMMRDASGRAQVAAPSASDDISTKGYVDSFAVSVGVSDTLALAYVPSEVELRQYPTARLQFRLSCPGSLRISFRYRATENERYTEVYIYRIRDGTATNLTPYLWPYPPHTWPNWITGSTDISGWLVGDYLGLYCLAPYIGYVYPMVKDLYIKASPIVRTV